jgi:asparagine synthase (glutamine-hydrolysing)
LIDDTLSESQVRKRGLLDPKVVAELIARHRLQQTDNTDHLLALVTLELWCRIFLDRAEAWDSAPSLDRVAIAR